MTELERIRSTTNIETYVMLIDQFGGDGKSDDVDKKIADEAKTKLLKELKKL